MIISSIKKYSKEKKILEHSYLCLRFSKVQSHNSNLRIHIFLSSFFFENQQVSVSISAYYILEKKNQDTRIRVIDFQKCRVIFLIHVTISNHRRFIHALYELMEKNSKT